MSERCSKSGEGRTGGLRTLREGFMKEMGLVLDLNGVIRVGENDKTNVASVNWWLRVMTLDTDGLDLNSRCTSS